MRFLAAKRRIRASASKRSLEILDIGMYLGVGVVPLLIARW